MRWAEQLCSFVPHSLPIAENVESAWVDTACMDDPRIPMGSALPNYPETPDVDAKVCLELVQNGLCLPYSAALTLMLTLRLTLKSKWCQRNE